ncbi:ion transporter [Treponema sp. C6A8]|uniref:ion transporter n=1 Tax=Treponema sp. C6A8 TaxID=1410609 RepID=UPI000480A58E|nr:ion transporter [Treponema sp. C6A8]
MIKDEDKNFCERLKYYVDGEADTLFEYFMLLVVIINTVILGLETSPSIEEKYSHLLFWLDQICLYIFVFELIIKAIAYNREFFGEIRTDEDGEKFFHMNKWNIFDLFIVLVSTIGSLPFFAVFRVFRVFKSIKFIKGLKSLRVMKTLKLINGITSLRVMVKAIIKAFPSVLWTFSLLLIFAYVYAIIGTSIFSIDFPDYFGSLKLAFFSLFGLTSINSSVIIARFSWAWIYFVSYNFFEASIIMNVIVGVIVDAVNDSRKEIDEDSDEKSEVTLETLAKQIEEINEKIDKKF